MEAAREGNEKQRVSGFWADSRWAKQAFGQAQWAAQAGFQLGSAGSEQMLKIERCPGDKTPNGVQEGPGDFDTKMIRRTWRQEYRCVSTKR